MKLEASMQLIEQELQPFFKKVPKPLLNRIERIVNETRTVIRREIGLPDRLPTSPDMESEWLKICELHNLDPVTAKTKREEPLVAARTHFVRYLFLKYDRVTLKSIGKFLGRDHSTVIHMRDRSKVNCPIPPFYQKRYIVTN
jgi:chromosomal replication initiation ATPase DnaA